jgi:hypothetical protein
VARKDSGGGVPFRYVVMNPDNRQLLCDAVVAVILALTGAEDEDDEGVDPTLR